MAIIITASQIYEISSNEKIIDNIYKGIELDEITISEFYGEISDSIDVEIYNFKEDYYEIESSLILPFIDYVADTNENITNVERETDRFNIGQQHYYEEDVSYNYSLTINKNVRQGTIKRVSDIGRQRFNNFHSTYLTFNSNPFKSKIGIVYSVNKT